VNKQTVVGLVLIAFLAGALGDHIVTRVMKHRDKHPQISHIGVLVPDLNAAINEWRTLGYRDVEVSTADTGMDRKYHGAPLECPIKQAFLKGQPDIELIQPMCAVPNPWANELHESGMQLHHFAYYTSDLHTAIQNAKTAALEEIAEGRWTDNGPGYGEFAYLRKPGDAVIVEYLSHSN
jgi:hypothetical protein